VAISGPGYLRGRITDELTPAVARALGVSLAMRAAPGAKFVVGSDRSEGSAELKAAFSEGLLQRPLDVVDLGAVAAPLVLHAQRRLQAEGAALVSRSMLPPGSAGLAWRLAGEMPIPESLLATPPAPSDDALPPNKGRRGAARKARAASVEHRQPRALDISFDYVAHLQWRFIDAMNSAVDVVVAAEQPEWTPIARRYLQAVFPLGLFTAVEQSSSGAERLEGSGRSLADDLSDRVYRHQADMGLILGGHFDRLEIVDDQGVPFSPDESAWLTLSSFESELTGEAVVLDDRLSVQLDRAIAQWGGKAVRHEGDPSLIADTMRQSGALLGFDLDGRVFFRELEGEDDALLAACRLIAFLGEHLIPLRSIRDDCPPMTVSPEVLLPLPERTALDDLFACIERQWPSRPAVKIANGWALVAKSRQARVRLQPSRYSDALSIRFEGERREEMLLMADSLVRALPGELAGLLAGRAAIIG